MIATEFDPRAMPVRFSRLKMMSMSAAHYLDACRVESEESEEDSLALRLGLGVHAIVLGTPDVVVYAKRRAGKDWDAFEAEHSAAGFMILSEREHAEASRMASSIMRHREAMMIMFGPDATIETRIDWTYLGRAVRSTPDSYQRHILADMKTARTSHPAWFRRDALRQHYHVQAAAYREAIAQKTGHMPESAYLVTVEKTRPHAVTVFRLVERALEMGARTWRLWFEQLLACEQTNEWPSYTESIVDLDVDDGPVEIEIDGRLVEV